ncbi:PHD/FYVE-zinc-finger like domain-containing protein [Aspergillus coremiiformis]|uniref:PHD/FYVE-zinc-finger like domain-containing protein n=1 Tax=Aspergillus coremiiformis TaxID=138285 RepID=A0A5N6YWP1_9EURO|nr:PHD/FYVE-zinc-finger like domain-containing protein [Aspergillus coremiiformis]
MDEVSVTQLNEELVEDILAHFQTRSHPPAPEASPEPPKSRLSVEIPTISNSNEYDFLPGHFHVRCVIGEATETTNEPSYLVKLRSGETEKMSSSQLGSLSNGPEALVRFQNTEQVYESSVQSLSDMASSSGEGYASSDSVTRRRSTRARNTEFTDFFSRMSSEDDDTGSPSSDDVRIRSRASTRQRRLRKYRRNGTRSKGSYTGSDYGLKSTASRVSTRQRKALRKNLRERYEEDISEFEEVTKTQKFFGAKEIFHKASMDDPFRNLHSSICDVCYRSGDDPEKGPLVFCQGCTIAYHQACLGPRATREHLVTKVSEDLFILQCRRCLGVAHTKDTVSPHQGCCPVCSKKGQMSNPLRERLTPKQEQQLRQENDGKDPVTNVDMARVNNTANLLFRCTACHRAFHFDHISPEHKATGRCQNCSSAPGEVDAMVAWRPTDLKTYVTGYSADIMEELDKEYLIKWKSMSYNHTTWMPGTWVWGVVNPAMRRAFFKSNKNLNPHMNAEDAIPEDFLRADIIFDVQYTDGDNSNSSNGRDVEADILRLEKVTKAYIKFKGLSYEDAVWDTPPDRNNAERWADFQAAYEDWVKRDYTYMPDQHSLKKHLETVRKQNFKSSIVKDTQPETMTGGQLMDYQKDGVNWLYYMWFKQQNAILADEMGLGKTIQVIGLFATLIEDHKCWPFLVVVPNSTCPNWRKEIKAWVPSIRVVTYYGSSFSRQLAQKHEMFNEGSHELRCHVVVTSYETMTSDASRRVLAKIPWAGLVVDEGQRLKNDKSQLYESLSRIRFPFKLLLTGTPLQNNTRELFNLLQFCDPTKNAENLEDEYGILSKENIPELHNLIRPFFLRRTKAQVLTFLPPVVQIIVPVSMSVVQKKLYKSILAKNPQLIKAIFQRSNDNQGPKQTERQNLNNILMQLRKCLCHPFIYSRAIEEQTANAAAAHRQLVEAAGKLQLLEIMLPKLKERGHRVLIFSQFLGNLDIVEDFLDGLGLLHRRLDGRLTSLEKQKMIDQYNAEDSPYFAFLLSTRSGGVGINLATADTVIIMDPDFNPHQDMQALSRAHRIGQKNKVLVFQLMTRGSAEEKIMQIGKKKMVLDHVLIDRMVSEEDDGQDLESILRHGAQALFEDDDSGDIRYDSASVDKLLDRSQAEQASSPDENAPESQLSFARVWANDNQNLNELQDTEEPTSDSNAVWEKILKEREEAAAEEEARKAENLGRGKRKRVTVDYTNTTTTEISPTKAPHKRDVESDVEFRGDDVVESDTDTAAEELGSDEIERPTKKQKVRPFERVNSITNADLALSTAGMDGYMENRPSCLACNQNHPVGSCRLKLAGVEHCGLCGLAHFGHARTCPHLQSDTQVARMLDALKRSTEDPELILQAKKYLTGIRGDLAQRARKQASKAAIDGPPGATPTASNPTVARSTVIDLTDKNSQPPKQPGMVSPYPYTQKF